MVNSIELYLSQMVCVESISANLINLRIFNQSLFMHNLPEIQRISTVDKYEL